MMLALFHIVGLVALHGALRDVADQVGRHGYLIIFLLIAAESFAFPLPGEASLLVGAYEAQRGVFGLGWVIIIGALAAMTGDNLAYLFGRHAGRGLIERLLRILHVRPAVLERVDTYFGLHAGLTVFVARQLSPLRGLAALSAGSSQVGWRRFATFNALGGVVWATVVSLIAAVFVKRLDELADDLSLAGLIVLGAILIAVAVLAWRMVRSAQLAGAELCDRDQPTATTDRHPLTPGHDPAGSRMSRHGRCVCDRPAPSGNADDKEQAS